MLLLCLSLSRLVFPICFHGPSHLPCNTKTLFGSFNGRGNSMRRDTPWLFGDDDFIQHMLRTQSHAHPHHFGRHLFHIPTCRICNNPAKGQIFVFENGEQNGEERAVGKPHPPFVMPSWISGRTSAIVAHTKCAFSLFIFPSAASFPPFDFVASSPL